MANQIEAELLKYLKANLLLQITPAEKAKPELLLHRAGFEISEIAILLDKEYQAVQKVISRAGKKGRKAK
jgi:hypothetical protein